jgi:hypothetical protein
MNIAFDPKKADVNQDILQHTVISIGTTATELKGGSSRDPERQAVMIYNDSDAEIRVGGASVTMTGATRGIPVFKKQISILPIGDMPIYGVSTAGGKEVIVFELG